METEFPQMESYVWMKAVDIWFWNNLEFLSAEMGSLEIITNHFSFE